MKYPKFIQGLVERLSQGKPVHPPAAPPPSSSYVRQPNQLYVPYSIEEFARTFLHLLKVYPELPEHVRSMIEVWLEEYDDRVFSWLKESYGSGVGAIADAITKQVMEVQQRHAKSQADQAVENEIQNLEQQFRDDDGPA